MAGTYRTGTVAVTGGGATVVGTGTAFLANVAIGDIWRLTDEDIPYVVAGVADDTHLTLSAAYAGSTASGKAYEITRDFTPNGLPIPQRGDLSPFAVITQAFNKLDALYNGIAATLGGYATAIADNATDIATNAAAIAVNATAIATKQAGHALLTAISGVSSPAADKLWYLTGATTAALADFTATGRAIVAAASAAAARIVLGTPGYADLPGYIRGLELANNASDANNDIDIAAGVAMDSGNAGPMTLSGITKRLDAAWTVGTNQGGLDTGSKANSTTYHVWLIRRPDTGVVDALFSTSVSAPTMPANYTQKRWIGAVMTDSSGNIIGFVQNGDDWLLKVPALDYNSSTLGTTAALAPLTVPAGVKAYPKLSGYISNAASGNCGVLVTSPEQTDTALAFSSLPFSLVSPGSGALACGAIQDTWTDTSRRVRVVAGKASTTLVIYTHGFKVRR